MNFQFYLEKLQNSDVFKNFIKQNPDAFPCSGFFVIDKQANDNKQHFDFYVSSSTTSPPSLPEDTRSLKARDIDDKINEKNSDDNYPDNSRAKRGKSKENNENKPKIWSIQLESMQLIPLEDFDKVPEKISLEYDFDFDEIEKIIEKRMIREGVKNKIQKMLFSLQRLGGEDFLVGTVFISMLGMIKININLKNTEITDFEKKNFFDVLKIKK